MDRFLSNGVSKKDFRVTVTFWLLLLTCVLQEVCGQQCVGLDACTCVMSDGSGIVDISSLGLQNGEPRFKDVAGPGGYYRFSYNPCYGFNEMTCVNAAVCQTSLTESFQTGDQSSATWSYDGSNIQVSYATTTDITRKTLVTLRCDKTAESPTMVSYGETGFAEYDLEVTTKCACPGVCSNGIIVTVEVSLSAGSVMVIIFFVLLFVYLVAGVIFNRVQRQATGADMIPNVSFWSELPSLIKDGFVFTFSCVRGSGGKSGYDQV